MAGKTIGYMRVSTFEQNTNRQLEGMEFNRTFIDKASGKDTVRPQLEEMLLFVREGDIIRVQSIDRLARNLVDLRRLVERIISKGATLEFVNEKLLFSGEESPIATMMLSVMGSFAEFERAMMRERQREGIEIAKTKGVYKGRLPKLKKEQIIELHRRVKNREPKARIAREMGISRTTLYAYEKNPV
jgi:DNA invertase Pin-like site-specific DNA recombinase